MQIEILAAVSDWIFKQLLNLLLFLSDWYWGKLQWTYLPGHGGKVTLDKKTIFISHQKYKGGNRDYTSHFSVALETTSKFLIVFVRLILGKVEVDVFTGPRREINIRYKFDSKVNVKGLGCKYRFLLPFLPEFPSNN